MKYADFDLSSTLPAGFFASGAVTLGRAPALLRSDVPWLVSTLPTGLKIDGGSLAIQYRPNYDPARPSDGARRYLFAVGSGGNQPVVMCAWIDSALRFQMRNALGQDVVLSTPPGAIIPGDATYEFEWRTVGGQTVGQMVLTIRRNGVQLSTVSHGQGPQTAFFTGRRIFWGCRSDTEAGVCDGTISRVSFDDLVPAPTFTAVTTVEIKGVAAGVQTPVRFVLPFPKGALTDVSTLATPAGPAQASAIERWSDGSVRHACIYLRAAPGPVAIGIGAPSSKPGLLVADATGIRGAGLELASGRAPVINGLPLRCLVRDTAGVTTDWFVDGAGTVAFIETNGPTRATAVYDGPRFRARFTVHAGMEAVQIEFQLQNGDLSTVFGAPYAFSGLALKLTSYDPPVDSGAEGQGSGFISTADGTAMIVYGKEAGPSELGADGIALWPVQYGQLLNNGTRLPGVYYLDDMQAVIREAWVAWGATKLGFETACPNIAVVPPSYYNATACTLDAGGAFPAAGPALPGGSFAAPYTRYGQQTTVSARQWGWNFFGSDIGRKLNPANTGGWPYTAATGVPRFMITGQPADFLFARDWARGELNCMPQHLPGFNYARDNTRLRLTENPYQGWSWRQFDGRFGYNPAPGYPAGGGQQGRPRDDQHGWFYHVMEVYFLTGDPWIKDWYTFVAQFRRVRLHQQDPYPDMSARALGHALSHAIQAYRVTADAALLTEINDYVTNNVLPAIDPVTGSMKPTPDNPSTAPFQLGYLTRALMSLYELSPRDDVFKAIEGFVRWNLEHATWGYYTAPTAVSGRSDGSAMTFADAVAWYALQPTADKTLAAAAIAQLRTYINTGIGGGERPYVTLTYWTGDFCGRWVAEYTRRLGAL